MQRCSYLNSYNGFMCIVRRDKASISLAAPLVYRMVGGPVKNAHKIYQSDLDAILRVSLVY